jgi:hypothetical protein
MGGKDPWMDGFWGVETELLHAGHDLGLLCYPVGK